MGGSPEGSVKRVDSDVLEGGLGKECGEGAAHALADRGEVGEDAARVGDFDVEIRRLMEAAPGGGDLDGKVLAGLLEGAEGDGVSGGCDLGYDGDKGGEVGVGELVDEGDEVVEGSKIPVSLNGFEERRGGIAGGWLAGVRVEGVKGEADGVLADPVAGALVADGRTPTAGVAGLAGECAGDNIGSGAGDGEDAGAAVEGGVEGDLVVAGEDEGAGWEEVGEGAGGPLADDGDGDAGEADAGGANIGEGDTGEGGSFGEEVPEAGGGEVFADAKDLNGAGAGAGEGLVGLGPRVVEGKAALGFGSAGVEG